MLGRMRLFLPALFFLALLTWFWIPGAGSSPGDSPAAAPDAVPWGEILLRTERSPALPPGDPPEAALTVEWLTTLSDGRKEAARTGRPLFVTFRCLPCKQCASFDKDVLAGGPVLDPLLRQFVCVRLVDARDLDFRVFTAEGFQDFDLSWWGWFLSDTLACYGTFGGRDEQGDDTRISVMALARAMERVLVHHRDERRARWNIDGPSPNLKERARGPERLPGFSAYAKRHAAEMKCVHCHMVADLLWAPRIKAGTFDKTRDIYVWPLPENVGVTLERDHGLRVKHVRPASPAAQAGLQAGDILGAAAGRRLFSQTDFRGALHRAWERPAAVPIVWIRGEGEESVRQATVHQATLHLDGDWRKTVVDWRMSVSQGAIGAGPGFWPNRASAADRKRAAAPVGTLCVRPWLGRKPRGQAHKAGLRGNMLVVAVDGASPDLVGRAFMTWFRLRHERDDPVELTVVDRKNKRRTIRYKARGWGE